MSVSSFLSASCLSNFLPASCLSLIPYHPCTARAPEQMSVSSACPSSLSRAESYKDQRRKYRREKKRVARELLSTLKDPSVVVLADWLKVRGTLKGWTKLWCVLKPGMLLLYKSSKAKVTITTALVVAIVRASLFFRSKAGE